MDIKYRNGNCRAIHNLCVNVSSSMVQKVKPSSNAVQPSFLFFLWIFITCFEKKAVVESYNKFSTFWSKYYPSKLKMTITCSSEIRSDDDRENLIIDSLQLSEKEEKCSSGDDSPALLHYIALCASNGVCSFMAFVAYSLFSPFFPQEVSTYIYWLMIYHKWSLHWKINVIPSIISD